MKKKQLATMGNMPGLAAAALAFAACHLAVAASPDGAGAAHTTVPEETYSVTNPTIAIPDASTFTTSPLRNRVRVRLNAPVSDVWAVVGDHTRMPEYSAGVARVETRTNPDGSEPVRICHFRPTDGASEGLVAQESIRWYVPELGYATSAQANNAFGLMNDLSLITVQAADGATVMTWDQHYDSEALEAMRTEFDVALHDMSQRLVNRFGGSILERYTDGESAQR